MVVGPPVGGSTGVLWPIGSVLLKLYVTFKHGGGDWSCRAVMQTLGGTTQRWFRLVTSTFATHLHQYLLQFHPDTPALSLQIFCFNHLCYSLIFILIFYASFYFIYMLGLTIVIWEDEVDKSTGIEAAVGSVVVTVDNEVLGGLSISGRVAMQKDLCETLHFVYTPYSF